MLPSLEDRQREDMQGRTMMQGEGIQGRTVISGLTILEKLVIKIVNLK
jgi:hypothetical protein